MTRLRRSDEAVIGAHVRAGVADNLNGQVTAIDASGIITVMVDGYGEIPMLNPSGQDVVVGNCVSIRTYGKSINTAEISGLSAREADVGEPKVFWR